MVHSYVEYYLAVKRNEVLIHAALWINLKTLCLVKEANHKSSQMARLSLY